MDCKKSIRSWHSIPDEITHLLLALPVMQEQICRPKLSNSFSDNHTVSDKFTTELMLKVKKKVINTL